MRVFADLEELRQAKGSSLGTSDWIVIEQSRIDRFADATGDHQWIHVDAERAASGPFGTTVAHGYLTLSLLPCLGPMIYRVEGARVGINYGLDKVRFPAPVPVGSWVRARAELLEVTDIEGGVQLVVRYTVEREGGSKPVCVAESIARIFV